MAQKVCITSDSVVLQLIYSQLFENSLEGFHCLEWPDILLIEAQVMPRH